MNVTTVTPSRITSLVNSLAMTESKFSIFHYQLKKSFGKNKYKKGFKYHSIKGVFSVRTVRFVRCDYPFAYFYATTKQR